MPDKSALATGDILMGDDLPKLESSSTEDEVDGKGECRRGRNVFTTNYRGHRRDQRVLRFGGAGNRQSMAALFRWLTRFADRAINSLTDQEWRVRCDRRCGRLIAAATYWEPRAACQKVAGRNATVDYRQKLEAAHRRVDAHDHDLAKHEPTSIRKDQPRRTSWRDLFEIATGKRPMQRACRQICDD